MKTVMKNVERHFIRETIPKIAGLKVVAIIYKCLSDIIKVRKKLCDCQTEGEMETVRKRDFPSSNG